MKLLKIKDKIQKRVEESAWTLGGMKQYQKIRVELIIWAYIFFVGALALITEGIFTGFTFRFFSYMFLMGISLISFLGKSVQFKRFYILNKIKENQKEALKNE